MDCTGFRIDECLRRLRGLRRDIDASTATLHSVQLGMSLATTQFARLVADRRAAGEIAECLQQMRRLSAVVAKISKDLARAELKMRLEFALLDSLETRRAGIDTHPIPWRWMRYTPQ